MSAPKPTDDLYRAFGRLVKLHRERLDGLTQEKLGSLVGLSRTSITNIEKGRQHVSLHHLISIANALKVRPDTLLPTTNELAVQSNSRVANKLPPGIEPSIALWVEKISRD